MRTRNIILYLYIGRNIYIQLVLISCNQIQTSKIYELILKGHI